MISEDRQKHFAHILIDKLWGDELIDFDEDSEELVIRHAKQLIGLWVEEQGNIDNNVRAKLNSLKRDVHEGSSEWKVLYNKYYAEEMSRKGHK
jgi:uncharacterized protein